MSNPQPSSLAVGDLALSLAVHRPQSLREWRTWYATMRAARYALDKRGRPDLVVDYGVDADTITKTVRRWGGPPLPDGLFQEWFGTRRPVDDRDLPAPTTAGAASVIEVHPAPASRTVTAGTIGSVDDVLVDRAIGGDQAAAHLLTHEERQAVAGRMFAAGRSMTAICKVLHVNGTEAAKLIGAYRRRTESRAGAA